jgi:hypothetical protein
MLAAARTRGWARVTKASSRHQRDSSRHSRATTHAGLSGDAPSFRQAHNQPRTRGRPAAAAAALSAWRRRPGSGTRRGMTGVRRCSAWGPACCSSSALLASCRGSSFAQAHRRLAQPRQSRPPRPLGDQPSSTRLPELRLAVVMARVAVGTPRHPVAVSWAGLQALLGELSAERSGGLGRLRSCSRRGLACSSLVGEGHDPRRVRTERFGPTGT